MKKVDLLHGGWLNAPNGASSVLRSFYESKEIFMSESVELSFFTMDSIKPKSFDNTSISAESMLNRLKTFIKKHSKYNSFFSFLSIYGYYLRHAKKVAKGYVLNERNDSIIFIHDIFTCFFYLKYTTKNKKTVLVLHNNGDTFKMLRVYYPKLSKSVFYLYLLYIEKFVFKKVSKLGFVSKRSLEDFSVLHPHFRKEKLFYIHNGLPCSAYFSLQDRGIERKYMLCCVGTVSERKGQKMLVDALSRLTIEQRKQILVTFVGDGEKLDELRTYVNNLGLNETAHFVGRSSKVESYLLTHNIFILPSFDEGFPISILEGMRASMPIISTKIAGIPEMVIDGRNGILISPNVDELFYVLNHLDQYDFTAMGEESRLFFEEKFTIEKMIVNYCNLFKSL